MGKRDVHVAKWLKLYFDSERLYFYLIVRFLVWPFIDLSNLWHILLSAFFIAT